MDKTSYIEKFKNEIQNSCDAKLESQVLAALESGLAQDDFFVACNSLFYREYSRDVFDAEITEDTRKKNILQLHLTRSGIYDQLPEGLFYQPDVLASSTRTGDMAEEYKLNKRREYTIRRFFMPFENDFFWQRVQLEIEECALLEGLHSGILNNYFTNLWNIDPSIPKSLIIHLILLLPYVHRIAGNLTLTAYCLKKLLQENVTVKKLVAPITNSDEDQILELGEPRLGDNMLCGTTFYEPYPLLEFCIGPLRRSQVHDYLEGGNKEVFLKTFYNFFIPMDADIVTLIEVPDEKKNMDLKLRGEEEAVLGYSTFL